MKFLKSDYFRFGITAVIYILWVIWLQNYWFLLGLVVVFDIHISKKVNWSFWKKREGKNSTLVEWLDALIFAVIAVTLINIFLFQNYKIPTPSMEKSLMVGDHLYVSKAAYGPRIPNTPLAFPFAQHTLPLTEKTKSYLEWIKLPYKRLKGFGKVERDDAVVFNFPAGDTVVIQQQDRSYYDIVRDSAMDMQRRDKIYDRPVKSFYEYYTMGRQKVWDNFDIVVRPVDRRDNYIKRCVAIPGDTLEIVDGQVIVNGTPQKYIPGITHYYQVYSNARIRDKALDRLGIKVIQGNLERTYFMAQLSNEDVSTLEKMNNIMDIKKLSNAGADWNLNHFPHDTNYKWTLDNFGPLYIPEKGATVKIDSSNICFYRRIIGYYEKNDLEEKDGKIYINGKVANEYTFKMDYYWMMGDNRHSSLDSRFWGYVPEDHIVGKPKFVWLSVDKDKKFLRKIRWNRIFMGIK